MRLHSEFFREFLGPNHLKSIDEPQSLNIRIRTNSAKHVGSSFHFTVSGLIPFCLPLDTRCGFTGWVREPAALDVGNLSGVVGRGLKNPVTVWVYMSTSPGGENLREPNQGEESRGAATSPALS